jgi:hypothetical protein
MILMSKYRMFFFQTRAGHLVEICPTIGVQGVSQDSAIGMSQRIWDGLADEEPALGYSLLDTLTRRVCYTEVRKADSKALTMPPRVETQARQLQSA